MLERLQALEERYNKLNEMLSDSEVISDTNKLREYSKEQSDLEEAVMAYRKYKTFDEELTGARDMLNEKLDKEMADMVKEEVSELESEIVNLEEDRKSTRLNSSHVSISYAVFCLKRKKSTNERRR